MEWRIVRRYGEYWWDWDDHGTTILGLKITWWWEREWVAYERWWEDEYDPKAGGDWHWDGWQAGEWEVQFEFEWVGLSRLWGAAVSAVLL